MIKSILNILNNNFRIFQWPIVLFLFLFAGSLGMAADGDLDNTFGGGDGIVTTDIGNDSNSGYALAIQPDGKIVVAGNYFNGSNWDFAVARYNTSGGLDTSFDGDGIVTTAIGSFWDWGHAVAIQPDGKIVVAGYSYNGSNNDFAVVRYNTNGSLDTSFSGNGKVTTVIGSGDDDGKAVAIQSDGKIVVAGASKMGSYKDFAVVRFNTSGSLDTSFSGDGKVTTNNGSTYCYGFAVAIQPDGKIVVAGTSNNDFAVVRYNTNGSLDTSFDEDGIVTTDIDSNTNIGYAIAIQPDGKIVVAGYSYNGSNYDFAVVRYSTNGSLDTSFDEDGIVTTDIDSNTNRGYAVAIQSDGKIVVAGYSYNGSNNDFAVVRYSTNGSLDTSFDEDGIVTTDIDSSSGEGNALSIQPDGKIVMAGYSYNGSNNDFAVIRYGILEDFGDAPDPTYPTMLASNGARHTIDNDLYLGTIIDHELNGQSDATATGDDTDGTNDDDGIIFTAPVINGKTTDVTVIVSGNGYLDAWIDFNADGDWGDAFEQIFTSHSLSSGTNYLSFTVPSDAISGDTFSRFRFSSTGGLAYTGLASDGEVEDYMVSILVDTDGDGLPDTIEDAGCTDSLIADTDVDGLNDGLEDSNHNGTQDTGETNPCDSDSDDDGLLDGTEDANHDGIVDIGETDPMDSDSDDDGFSDGYEVNMGSDPLDPNSVPLVKSITGAIYQLLLDGE